MHVMFWGRSSYTTDADVAFQRAACERHGGRWSEHVDRSVAPELGDVDVLVVTSRERVSAERLAGAPSLELVVTTTSGYDHIDLEACASAGVRVARCPLARRDAVVDTSVGVGLSLLRDVPSLSARARDGVWARAELATRRLRSARGLRVGVIGCGVIGARAAEVWEALGAEVLRCDPALEGGVSVEAITEGCELITLHCSLTPSSRGLFDAARLERLRPDAVLINTARGACLDPDALGGRPDLRVGIDVFPREPWPELERLAARPNTLLLPHASGYHDDLGRAIARELEAALDAFARGASVPHTVLEP